MTIAVVRRHRPRIRIGGAAVALVALGLAAGVTRVSATVYPGVASDAAFRTAWSDATATEIDLTANITLVCASGAPTRNSTTALTIMGNEHTITYDTTPCPQDLLNQMGLGAVTVDDATLTLNSTSGSAISGEGPVTLTTSSISGTISGDGISTGGVVTVTGSSITGTYGGDGVDTGQAVTVTGSTISGTIAGNGVDTGASVALSGSSISGSIAGSGISTGGAVTLTDSSIGGTITGDGIVNGAAVTLTRSSISGAFGGNGISNGAAVTLTGSTVNTTSTGQNGISTGSAAVSLTDSSVLGSDSTNGNGISASGTVTLVRSTVARTSVTGNGIATGNTVALTNSTVTDAGSNGISTSGAITLVYSDVTGNGFGTGGFGGHNVAGGAFTSFGSVVTHGKSGDCSVSSKTSQGYNYADDTSCGFTGTGDSQAIGNDPKLSALANNGGPTETLLPQTGSPLINAIPHASCQSGNAAGITADQRSLARPDAASDLCDIGSVEVQPAVTAPIPTPTPPTPATGGGGAAPVGGLLLAVAGLGAFRLGRRGLRT